MAASHAPRPSALKLVKGEPPPAWAASIEAEQAAIGACLLSAEAITTIRGIIAPADFYDPRHGAIFAAILELAGAGTTVDMVTLAEHLQRLPGERLAFVGGAAYLGELAQNTPSALNARRYAELVHEKAASRRLHLQGPDPEIPAEAEDSLALAYTQKHGEDRKFCAELRQWFEWDGGRWRPDTTLHSFDLARDVCRDQARKSEKGRDKIASAKTVAAIERLVRADRAHAVTADVFDADPLLLNAPDCTIELATGTRREHRKADWLTKSTAVSPADTPPAAWLGFLERVTGGDGRLIEYLQRLVGYCLTGLTGEHVLAFLYGSGANGKSTFLNAIAGMLGDYATVASAETFLESNGERHPADLAMLRGARLVIAQEIDEGRRLNISRVKAITGGDRITARFMRADYFTFTPQFKLAMGANHRPALRSVDPAIARRFHVVPFTQQIPEDERDPDLPEKLREEYGAILAWALEGCAEWHLQGLRPPQSVLDATRSYLSSEDVLAHWLEECTQEDGHAHEIVGGLYASYRSWAERAGERFLGTKRFSQALEDRGLERVKLSGGVRGFRGVRLRVLEGSGAADRGGDSP